MVFLNETFGQLGTAATFFGGQWWMVGLFLILVFAIYFYGKGVPAEGLMITIFSAVILISIDGLFDIVEEYMFIIIIPILIFIGIVLSIVLDR